MRQMLLKSPKPMVARRGGRLAPRLWSRRGYRVVVMGSRVCREWLPSQESRLLAAAAKREARCRVGQVGSRRQ